jgi:hypothetical protein
MGIKDIVAQIDAEIIRVQRARTLLASTDAPALHKHGQAPVNFSKPAKKKHNLTPQGRARIAEAVKRRWAKQKATAKRNGKA